MIRFILINILLIISFTSNAGEAFFRPLERKVIQLAEGDSFKGVIELWNIQNVSPEMIYELEGKTFLESFYVVKLEKPKWSENNPEVVVIEGLFVLEKKLSELKKVWKLGGLDIEVNIKEFETKTFDKKQKGFIVLEGKYNVEEKHGLTIPIVFLTVLLVLGFAAYFFKKNKKITKDKKVNVDWKKVFDEARSIQDFSTIYEDRYKWRSEIDEDALYATDFLKNAEEILYKKEIQDYEIEQLKVSAEKLSKSFRV